MARNAIFLTSLFLLLVCSEVFAERSEQRFGPVGTSNQYPLAALHLSSRPESPYVLENGKNEYLTAFSWSSTAIVEDFYTIDAETRQLEFGFAKGISDAVELGIKVPLLWRGAGVLDSFINDFHDLFSLPEGDRNLFSDDDYTISGLNRDGASFDLDSDGIKLGQIEINSKYLLVAESGGVPALALRLGIGLPTAASAYGPDTIDTMLSILGAKGWGRWTAYFGSSHLYYAEDNVQGVHFRRNHLEGFGQFQYQVCKSLALNVGLFSHSELIRELSKHPSYSLYLDMGGVIRLSSHLFLDLLVRENPSPGDGTTDVSFGTAVRWRE